MYPSHRMWGQKINSRKRLFPRKEESSGEKKKGGELQSVLERENELIGSAPSGSSTLPREGYESREGKRRIFGGVMQRAADRAIISKKKMAARKENRGIWEVGGGDDAGIF